MKDYSEIVIKNLKQEMQNIGNNSNLITDNLKKDLDQNKNMWSKQSKEDEWSR